MMTSSVKIDLPKTSSAGSDEQVEIISVSAKSDGSIFLQDEAIKLGSLPKKLLELTKNDLSNKICIRADKKIDYGRVIEILSVINLAGFTQVTLETQLIND